MRLCDCTRVVRRVGKGGRDWWLLESMVRHDFLEAILVNTRFIDQYGVISCIDQTGAQFSRGFAVA